MKSLFLAFLLPSLTFASGTSREISTETREIHLDNNAELQLSCEPGQARMFPTPSVLMINGLAKLFDNKTVLDFVGFDDTRTGDHCKELELFFRENLPATLTVTLKTTETCIQDDTGRDNRAHYTTWQEISGTLDNENFGLLRGASDVIAERWEPNSRCK